ncbi:LysE family translocator [Aureimonas pseudogalii]|uniref:Threonine/homoserine/homoserine lactone efflux protein n=1 Tax=Aureimonas pseudogalii TaxID=1744844 RepID=A0A7W6H5U1_9HYPH|nr:LysE family translocator [Aureimonas pseudogalii]MBB3999079.1 threonine/homoserine/homoserine lactone efflux protein [Aureimonas pseudogalii]
MNWEFLLTTFVVVVSPGTGAIYTLAAGLSGGSRPSIVAAFGCTLGIVPHMIAAISGVAALFHASDMAFQALKFAGVVYLLFMAWSMLRAEGALGLEHDGTVPSSREVIEKAILINLLNPKLSIFFLAFLPQFVGADEPAPIARMLLLSLVFMAVTFVVFAAYGIFASTLRRYVLTNLRVQRWMQRSFAVAFSLLALQLALTSR